MREYVMSVGGKEFHAGIKELNAEYALVQVDDTEYKVILKQLGSGQSVFSGLARGVRPGGRRSAAVNPPRSWRSRRKARPARRKGRARSRRHCPGWSWTCWSGKAMRSRPAKPCWSWKP